jgi:hypothetical protein
MIDIPPFIKYNRKKEKIKSKKEKEYNVIILALILLLLFRWLGRTFHKGTAKKQCESVSRNYRLTIRI